MPSLCSLRSHPLYCSASPFLLLSRFLCFFPFFTNSLFLSVTLAHSQNFSLPASIALPSHTLCRNTNDFSGMRMRLKSGLRLFCPCRQRVSMSNLIHVNSQEEWCIRRTVREEKSGTERERGREGVRERERSHLCIVTADFTLTLSLLHPVEQEGAPGGTFTKWGNTHLLTHTYTLYCTYTHSDTLAHTDIPLQNTHMPTWTYSEKLLVDTFRHTQSHLRPVYRIRATEWLLVCLIWGWCLH